MASENQKKCGFGCGFVLLIVFIGLMGGSVKVLGITDCGLHLEPLSKKVAEQVYFGGRHFLGPGHQFIVFPLTHQSVTFDDRPGSDATPLAIASQEGHTISIKVSFQYKLEPETVRDLYFAWQTQYHNIIVAEATQSLKTAASGFSALQYFDQRKEIAARMQDTLVKNQTVPFTLMNFQLNDVDMPATFELEILNKVTKDQNALTEEQRIIPAEIRAVNGALKQAAQNTINILLSEGKAKGELSRRQNMAKADREVQEATADALFQVGQDLNMTKEEIVRYNWIRTWPTISNANVYVGFEDRTPEVKTV